MLQDNTTLQYSFHGRNGNELERHTGGRFVFDCRFTPEIRKAIRQKRIALGLPYHAVAEFFSVNWSTFRKWELGPTETCELIHRPLLENFLNGDYDRILLSQAQASRLSAPYSDAPEQRPVQLCMERMVNAYSLCLGHADIVETLLENVNEATRNALAAFIRASRPHEEDEGLQEDAISDSPFPDENIIV